MNKPLATALLRPAYIVVFAFLIGILYVDYHIFLVKTQRIAAYDELNDRLNNIRVSVTRLEYLLDMYVISRTFEPSTITLIKGDIESLDRDIHYLADEPRFIAASAENPFISEGLSGMKDDWKTILNEIKSLSGSLSQDEIILIHNAFDTNTILVTEKTERLLALASDSRIKSSDEINSLALLNLIGFAGFLALGGFIYHRNVRVPLKRLSATAEAIISGSEVNFDAGRSQAAYGLSQGLNAMVSGLRKRLRDANEDAASLKKKLIIKDAHIEALRGVSTLASRSLSIEETLSLALKEARISSGAGAGAIYLNHDGALTLKASDCAGDDIFRKIAVIMHADVAGLHEKDTLTVFADAGEFPHRGLNDALKAQGLKSIHVIPLSYGSEVLGCIFMAYEGGGAALDDTLLFLDAYAKAIAVQTAHIALFQKEYGLKSFLERIVNQLPFGVAVFDRTGACQVFNTGLKKMLGADRRFSLINLYNVFEDAVLSANGIISSVKKTYEGYSTEFVISYNPTLAARHYFSGPQRKIKIKTCPLYDIDGSISNIVLFYEDLGTSQEQL